MALYEDKTATKANKSHVFIAVTLIFLVITLPFLLKHTFDKPKPTKLTQITLPTALKASVPLGQTTAQMDVAEKALISFLKEAQTQEAIQKPSFESQVHLNYVTGTIQHSLYVDARKKGLTHKVIQQLTTMFSEQLPLESALRKNDRFTLVYGNRYDNKGKPHPGNILAASLTNRKKTYYGIRYQRKNHKYDYYSLDGKSLRLGFSRYPIQFRRISSRFNLHRIHPILHINRAHKGVDLAAKIGTPIRAIADGRITQIGHNGGYGNMITLRHSSKYRTVYAHMLRFKKGLRRKRHVKRGDVIGYVGQSGVATGPHCHFEFHVYNRSVNPVTVKLPRAEALTKKELKAFTPIASTLIAQLQRFEAIQLARHN